MLNGMARYGFFWYSADDSYPRRFLSSGSLSATDGGAAIAALMGVLGGLLF